MPRATVIEVNKGRAIIMTEQCEFKEIKTNRPLQAGDEIDYDPNMLSPGRRPLSALAWAASFIICCLLAFSTIQYLTVNRVNARVGLEINPSLEISINKDYVVVGTMAFNKDGQNLIAGQDLKGKTLDVAISQVIGQCLNQKYLHENDNYIGVSITSETPDPRLLGHVKDEMDHALAARKVNATVYYFTLNQTTRNDAIKRGISPLRYLLWKRAQENGINMQMSNISLNNPVIRQMAGKTASAVLEQGWPGTGTGDAGIQTKPLDNGALTRNTNALPNSSQGVQSDNSSNFLNPAEQTTVKPASPVPLRKKGSSQETTAPAKDGSNSGLGEGVTDGQTPSLNTETSPENSGQSNTNAPNASPGGSDSGKTGGDSGTGGTANGGTSSGEGSAGVSGNGVSSGSGPANDAAGTGSGSEGTFGGGRVAGR